MEFWRVELSLIPYPTVVEREPVPIITGNMAYCVYDFVVRIVYVTLLSSECCMYSLAGPNTSRGLNRSRCFVDSAEEKFLMRELSSDCQLSIVRRNFSSALSTMF